MSSMCVSHCAQWVSMDTVPLPALPLDPLVDSLVACQRLTSLDLSEDLGHVTLSLQSLLAVVKGLHNLRALGLEEVSLSDERVSD